MAMFIERPRGIRIVEAKPVPRLDDFAEPNRLLIFSAPVIFTAQHTTTA
jgi:hypothetical protein